MGSFAESHLSDVPPPQIDHLDMGVHYGHGIHAVMALPGIAISSESKIHSLKVRLHAELSKVAKLGEIKLKQVPQLNTANSSPLIRKHKEVLNLMMRTLSLDTYGLTWAQFFKGFGLGGLAVWLLMR